MRSSAAAAPTFEYRATNQSCHSGRGLKSRAFTFKEAILQGRHQDELFCSVKKLNQVGNTLLESYLLQRTKKCQEIVLDQKKNVVSSLVKNPGGIRVSLTPIPRKQKIISGMQKCRSHFTVDCFASLLSMEKKIEVRSK